VAMNVKCPRCSKTFTIDDKFAGRTFTCPCGVRIPLPPAGSLTSVPTAPQVTAEPIPLTDLQGARLSVPLGRVEGRGGSLNFECEASANGEMSLVVFAYDGDARTKGVLLHLTANAFYELKGIVDKASEIFRATRIQRKGVKRSGVSALQRVPTPLRLFAFLPPREQYLAQDVGTQRVFATIKDQKLGIARIMNSSNSGTVNAMSPCAGL
jgi:hypothetical protein